MTDGAVDKRVSRLLIPDNTPLSLLAWIGGEALDWLFVVGAEVWVTDMVKAEALRDPDPGEDPRAAHRAEIVARCAVGIVDAFVREGIGADGLDVRTDLAGLNLNPVPAVYVECGNMRNAADAARMSSPAGREAYAKQLAAGILDFLGR